MYKYKHIIFLIEIDNEIKSDNEMKPDNETDFKQLKNCISYQYCLIHINKCYNRSFLKNIFRFVSINLY